MYVWGYCHAAEWMWDRSGVFFKMDTNLNIWHDHFFLETTVQLNS